MSGVQGWQCLGFAQGVYRGIPYGVAKIRGSHLVVRDVYYMGLSAFTCTGFSWVVFQGFSRDHWRALSPLEYHETGECKWIEGWVPEVLDISCVGSMAWGSGCSQGNPKIVVFRVWGWLDRPPNPYNKEKELSDDPTHIQIMGS